MATTTNYGWTTPDDTALVKDGASAIRTLGSSVDTTTKALNPSTTLGDIEYRSSTANTNTRLGIGSTGQVLTVAGGVPSWGTISSGGMTLISEQTPSAVSSLSFSSIAGTYKQLLLIWSGVRHSATSTSFSIRLNNNSTSIYRATNPGITDTVISNQDGNQNHLGTVDFPALGANVNATQIRWDARGSMLIDNYASTTRPKLVTIQNYFYDNGLGSFRYAPYSGIFDDTTAITSIDIVRLTGSATFSTVNNSSIRLYGLS